MKLNRQKFDEKLKEFDDLDDFWYMRRQIERRIFEFVGKLRAAKYASKWAATRAAREFEEKQKNS